jgi:hypothetical protein
VLVVEWLVYQGAGLGTLRERLRPQAR